MPGASLALFADLGACHVQKSSVTICVLPAPSGWRATSPMPKTKGGTPNFYPRPPGGGRPFRAARDPRTPDFYPRPPGGGRHVDACRCIQNRLQFQSTPSGWRATVSHFAETIFCGFLSTPSGWRATSLHRRCRTKAPNFYPRPPGGGRQYVREVRLPTCYFYPRPPGGGRLTPRWEYYKANTFLSTPSGWRATE